MANPESGAQPHYLAAPPTKVAVWVSRLANDLVRETLRLSPLEAQRVRGEIAVLALRGMPPDAAMSLAERALAYAGPPLPPINETLADARWWASVAARNELKAYALACFEALPAADQSAFLDHVAGRAAA